MKTSPSIIVSMLKRGGKNHRENHFLVRYLERLPVGCSYPFVAERTAEVIANIRQKSNDPHRLDLGYAPGPDVSVVYFDATGLGEPVLALFESKIRDTSVVGVYFTHGDRRTKVDSSNISLGKAYLVARLQTLLQTGYLHLPKTAEAGTLAEDLLGFEIRVDENANERQGAFRVGIHDDLVTALGLAVQIDPYTVECLPLDFI